MAENLFSSLDISGKGMSLQRARLSAVANNIANVNTTRDAEGNIYKRQVVVAQKVTERKFDNMLEDQLSLSGTDMSHGGNIRSRANAGNVLQFKTEEDETPPRLIYDPAHPHANDKGYVEVPNINIVTEMVEMMTAQRAFEANVQVTEAAKNIAKYSLEI
ncbi:MAG: flagellar basal body rod protein FlgC [Candidatus Kapabacteria bacterium]|nr:flagellar basal body rod protein FlgC [Ignavibacteriota bacterium]MCW5886046.1 flagellar basal body rod protein FlgC [Candidatus Kapabacteria bacterium]